MARFALAAILLGLVPTCVLASPPVVVFSTDFESGIPAQISAPGAQLDAVQGFAGLGPVGRKFNGNFLRYVSVPILPTTLTIRNLPAHDHLSVKFLLGIIDSWDGAELMRVQVDNSLRFNHWFQLAQGDTTDYFPAPAGAILSMGTDLGFSGCCFYNRDRAYDLGAESAFRDIPHTADSVVVLWTLGAISGPAAAQWQGGSDESWAIDAVSVEVSTQTTGVGGETAAAAFALTPLANPARGSKLRFLVALPLESPARLDLLDLTGRRVSSRAIGGGAGSRTIELSPNRSLTAGIYFARLSQSGTTRSARLVITN